MLPLLGWSLPWYSAIDIPRFRERPVVSSIFRIVWSSISSSIISPSSSSTSSSSIILFYPYPKSDCHPAILLSWQEVSIPILISSPLVICVVTRSWRGMNGSSFDSARCFLHYVGHELVLPICYHLSSKTDGTIEGDIGAWCILGWCLCTSILHSLIMSLQTYYCPRMY